MNTYKLLLNELDNSVNEVNDCIFSIITTDFMTFKIYITDIL